MKMKIIILCFITSILLCSCVEQRKYTASSKNTYIKCYAGNLPDNFSPVCRMNYSEYNGLFNYLFEGLVSTDKGGNVISALSDKWIVSDNGLEYEFHIRKNAKWSDGEEITSKDFVKLFKYLLAPQSKNNSIDDLFNIYGAKDYHAGKAPFSDVAIKARDSKNLKIRLNRPCSAFIKMLASTDFLLREGSYELENLSYNFSTIKFSGPFIIKDSIREGIVLDKNGYYWNKNNVRSNTFLFMNKISCEEALAKFENGDVDLIVNPPVSEIERFMDSGSLIENSPDIIALSFNLHKKSNNLLDKETRTQIINKLDLESIKKRALKNYKPDNYEVFKRVYSPNMQSHTAPGINKIMDTHSISMLCVNDGVSKRIAEQIRSQLKDKLNMNVYITLCNYDDVKKTMEKGNYQMLLFKYQVGYDRQLGIFENLTSHSNENYIGYKSNSFDGLMERAFYLNDTAKLAIFRKCEDLIKNSEIYFPMYYDTDVVLSNDYLSGVDYGYNGYMDIQHIKENNS
ncbi:ABC transporter substrate-binding protein [Clostridium oryzae]|uniref:Dipeptide-binding protein DppE n=1 Tax=Clostridium oryzae TaxID=1450648 RepID=A0A1V4IWN1_9CLOT|nr:ABC transporter substrate-binding protein [Clostridium oryzae]OPJ64174.1 dipeptide-binding protein DppE precursor [Clostridium oryzae]